MCVESGRHRLSWAPDLLLLAAVQASDNVIFRSLLSVVGSRRLHRRHLSGH